MTEVQKLAQFVVDACWDRISIASREHLKIHLLDSLACAIGALEGEPVRAIRATINQLDSRGSCRLIGARESTAPDRAALYNCAAVRYLDYNDSYLAAGETCHPSDNIAAILSAADFVKAAGRDALTAIAAAYQVQCRLSDVAPVRERGFDHVTQLAYSASVGISKVLGLDSEQTANAIALSGTAGDKTVVRTKRAGGPQFALHVGCRPLGSAINAFAI